MTRYWIKFGFAALVIFAVVFAAGYYLTALSLYVIWLVSWSFAALGLFGLDKAESKRTAKADRVPERLLHTSTLLGGFVGSGVGMVIFNHKTSKRIFWLMLVLGLVLHLAVGQFF